MPAELDAVQHLMENGVLFGRQKPLTQVESPLRGASKAQTRGDFWVT